MNTRLMACTVVLMLASGVASCGGTNSSSTPLSPSTPFSLPVPQPPVIGLAGNYTVTFEADRSCEQFPDSLKTRTYSAIIGYVGPSQDGTRDYFRADLTGSDFDGYYRSIYIRVTESKVHFDFSDNFIVEEPEPETYLTILGGDGETSVDPSNLSAISASFDGIFNHCKTSSEIDWTKQHPMSCPANAVAHDLCRSKNSRWTLTRR